MSKEKIKNCIFWPTLFSIMLIFILNISALYCNAEESNYYDVSESSRPPSAFSICCCSKQSEEDFQIVLGCKYIEDTVCPENSKQYKTSIGDCPSNLMFTKYKPKIN